MDDLTPSAQWREAHVGKNQPTETSGGAASAGEQSTIARAGKMQSGKGPGSRRSGAQTRQTMEEPTPMLDVDGAMEEITRVPAATIHRAAAFAWASRAIAGYRVCSAKAVMQEGLSYLYLGEHYREAALAHATMGDAWEPLFTEIEQAMAKDRKRAFASMRGHLPAATR